MEATQYSHSAPYDVVESLKEHEECVMSLERAIKHVKVTWKAREKEEE